MLNDVETKRHSKAEGNSCLGLVASGRWEPDVLSQIQMALIRDRICRSQMKPVLFVPGLCIVLDIAGRLWEPRHVGGATRCKLHIWWIDMVLHYVVQVISGLFTHFGSSDLLGPKGVLEVITVGPLIWKWVSLCVAPLCSLKNEEHVSFCKTSSNGLIYQHWHVKGATKFTVDVHLVADFARWFWDEQVKYSACCKQMCSTTLAHGWMQAEQLSFRKEDSWPNPYVQNSPSFRRWPKCYWTA